MKPLYVLLILAVAFTGGGIALMPDNAAAGWALLIVGILLSLVTAGQAIKESK